MIEVLLDPAFIAAFGTFGGGFFLARAERRLKKKKSVEPVMEIAKDPYARDSSDPYQCAIWEIRWFEKRLVDEGTLPLRDMSVCDDGACANCSPTREARIEHRTAINQKNIEKAALEAKMQRDKAAREWQMRKAQEAQKHSGRTMVEGTWVTRPPGVPEWAAAKTMYDPNMLCDYIYWSWTDRATGTPMAAKSLTYDIKNAKVIDKSASRHATTVKKRCGCNSLIHKSSDGSIMWRSDDASNCLEHGTLPLRIEKFKEGAYDDRTIEEIEALGIPHHLIAERINPSAQGQLEEFIEKVDGRMMLLDTTDWNKR